MHVRRTDKVGTEAAFHGIEEYMGHIDEYFNQLELKEKVDKRRIYLATDDPKVITDAKEKYPHYEILGDPLISKTAAVTSRYSGISLNGIIIDIHMLSMSDYLVCTFSSQVSLSSFVFNLFRVHLTAINLNRIKIDIVNGNYLYCFIIILRRLSLTLKFHLSERCFLETDNATCR